MNTREIGIVEKSLQQGAENAVSIDYLLTVTGHKTARALQSEIAREREAGALILSSNRSGYYLPDSGEKGRQEIARFISTLRARSLNTLRILKPARRALMVVDGQTEIHGDMAQEESKQ